MGFREIWLQVTGHGIKEISPQDSNKWHNQPRPRTTEGKRLTRRAVSQQNISHHKKFSWEDSDTLVNPSPVESKKVGSWRRRLSISGLKPPPTPTQDIPSVPTSKFRTQSEGPTTETKRALSSTTTPIPRSPADSTLSSSTKLTNKEMIATALMVATAEPPPLQRSWPTLSQRELPSRPGTATTVDEVVLPGMFELAADTPRSARPQSLAVTPRKRSKSTASDISVQRRASWFNVGRRKGALPPLPNATGTRPATSAGTPTPFIAELPAFEKLPQVPLPVYPKEADSPKCIIRGFPSVPNLRTLEQQPSEERETTITTFTRPASRRSSGLQKPAPNFSQPRSPMLPPANWSRPLSTDANAAARQRSSTLSSAGSNLARYEERSVKRVTKFVELMEFQRSGGIGTVSEDPPSKDVMPEQSFRDNMFSNIDALSKLEVGVAS